MSSSVYIPSSSGSGSIAPPNSISIKTASYTIPAGKFAVVKNLHGDLTINTVPHYTILSSFTRTLTTSTGTTDSLLLDKNIDFIKCTRTSSVSNVNNKFSCDYYVLHYLYYGVGSIVPFSTTSASSAQYGLFYLDTTFAGTRTAYINPNITNFGVGTGSTTSPVNSMGAYAIAFGTYRISGTVTHSAFSASFDKSEFLVPSGTVLDGVRYMVSEYTI